MPVESLQQTHERMQMNWGIQREDLLAILVLLALTLGIAAYLQFIITSVLNNAEDISQWPILP